MARNRETPYIDGDALFQDERLRQRLCHYRRAVAWIVAVVARAYRMAMDAWAAGPENWDPKPFMDELDQGRVSFFLLRGAAFPIFEDGCLLFRGSHMLV